MVFTASIMLLSSGQYCIAEEFLISAPPNETRELSAQLYEPVAAFLSEVTADTVTYIYSENWPNYILKMQQARYDFIIDAPHFISWRIENIDHTALAMLARNLGYVVIASEPGHIDNLSDLRAGSVCSAPPPDLDALTLLDQYDSDWSLPKIVAAGGYVALYNGLSTGDCDASVLPGRVYRQLAGESGAAATKVLFRSRELPHYGLSSGPRVSARNRERIRQTLDSTTGRTALTGLLNYFGLTSSDLSIEIDSDVYQGYDYLLDDFWGF